MSFRHGLFVFSTHSVFMVGGEVKETSLGNTLVILPPTNNTDTDGTSGTLANVNLLIGQPVHIRKTLDRSAKPHVRRGKAAPKLSPIRVVFCCVGLQQPKLLKPFVRQSPATTMHLMYTLDESGNRLYTLKVRYRSPRRSPTSC